MAKLSAHGQTEIFRVVKEVTLTEESKQRGVLKTILKRALMDNGKIVENQVTWFTDQYAKSGQRRNDYGWKVRGHLKDGGTKEKLLAQYEREGYKLDE